MTFTNMLTDRQHESAINGGQMLLKRSLTFIFVIIMAVFFAQGCTLIGYGIGRSIDRSRLADGYLEIGDLKFGDERIFIFRNGSSFTAIFNSLDTLGTDIYHELYKRIQDAASPALILPEIGDTLSGVDSLIFRAFIYCHIDSPAIFRADRHVRHISLEFESLRSRKIIRMPLTGPRELHFKNNRTFKRSQLIQYANEGTLPLNAKVVFTKSQISRSTELNNIEEIRHLKSGNAGLIGILAGALIDAGIIALAIVAAIEFASMGSWGSLQY